MYKSVAEQTTSCVIANRAAHGGTCHVLHKLFDSRTRRGDTQSISRANNSSSNVDPFGACGFVRNYNDGLDDSHQRHDFGDI